MDYFTEREINSLNDTFFTKGKKTKQQKRNVKRNKFRNRLQKEERKYR